MPYALTRHWLLIVLCVVVGVGAAVAVAMTRHPTYKAESTLNVGSLDAQTQALPGFIDSATSLAASYSRVATSDRLEGAVAQQLHLPLSQVRSNLSAVNVPNAPLMRIDATSSSKSGAIRLAQAATDQLQRYIAQLTSGGQSDQLINQYETVSAQADRLDQQVAQLQAQRSATGSTAVSAQLTRLQVQAAATRLRATTLASLYTQARQNSTGSASVQVLSRPTSAASDRSHVLQRLIVIGIVAGLVLGASLAVLAERGRRR